MALRRIVIVGNSAAALSALAVIRRLDAESPVTVVSEEDTTAYSRVLLPHLIGGEIRDAVIRTPDFYGGLGVRTLFGVEAVAIRDGAVCLADGTRLPFDKLLLATGSRAAVPRIPGIGAAGVFTLKNLADAQAIRERLSTARHVLVAGGGLICLLVVRALLKRGLKVTVAVSADRILSRMLDPEGGRRVGERLRDAAVDLRTNTDVTQIVTRDGSATGAVLSGGVEVPADLVVVAKGIRSRIELAATAGLRTGRGILVDRYMRTSAPDVYAAGDAAESGDLLVKGKRTVCGTWFEAVHQGGAAGFNMMGVARPTLGSLKMNVMDAAGLPVASVGLLEAPDGTGETILREDADRYRKLVLWNGCLVGAVLVGDVSDAGVLASLIRRRLPLAPLPRLRLRDGARYADLLR